MTGAEYIAEFLRLKGSDKVFLMTGGAAAFIVDAISRNKGLKYVCFHHEQAAAMAADAVWRTSGKIGVTVATSGPGATNLITGIACSYFDSIPSIHITGQVNQNEKANYGGANVRQAGFQETKIVEMVRPITKWATQVTNVQELKLALNKAYAIAPSGRPGPVLIDVPMDVQQAEAGEIEMDKPSSQSAPDVKAIQNARTKIEDFLKGSERPLLLVGAGIGLAGVEKATFAWIKDSGIPFVSSWNGETYFDHDLPNYCGNIGVYGNRGANFLIQNSDRLIVLGSRLDNRQRSGNTTKFAMSAKVLVLDVDAEELRKYKNNREHSTAELDFKFLPQALEGLKVTRGTDAWTSFAREMKAKYFGKYSSSIAKEKGTLSPYEVVRAANAAMNDDAVVAVDTGANLCWVFQQFHRRKHTIFTAGGNSPMGYCLPAAIGAAIYSPGRQIVAFSGDGGFHLNIQELQLLVHHKIPAKIFVMNNCGYGIIKQFQEQYLGGRYEATGNGYSIPDFGKVARAYGLGYVKVTKMSDFDAKAVFASPEPTIIDCILFPETTVEPKLGIGRSIEDQLPYMSNEEYAAGVRFVSPANLAEHRK